MKENMFLQLVTKKVFRKPISLGSFIMHIISASPYCGDAQHCEKQKPIHSRMGSRTADFAISDKSVHLVWLRCSSAISLPDKGRKILAKPHVILSRCRFMLAHCTWKFDNICHHKQIIREDGSMDRSIEPRSTLLLDRNWYQCTVPRVLPKWANIHQQDKIRLTPFWENSEREIYFSHILSNLN